MLTFLLHVTLIFVLLKKAAKKFLNVKYYNLMKKSVFKNITSLMFLYISCIIPSLGILF